MATTPSDFAIHVLQPPLNPSSLQTYASVFRDLRLQALREDAESFTEDYADVSARAMHYWKN